MPPWIQIAPLALTALTASCASSPRISLVAPQIEMPAEARKPCGLHILPDAPRVVDLELGYAQRGAQILACDAARRLAVEIHDSEHLLETSARPAGVKRLRPPAFQVRRTGR